MKHYIATVYFEGFIEFLTLASSEDSAWDKANDMFYDPRYKDEIYDNKELSHIHIEEIEK